MLLTGKYSHYKGKEYEVIGEALHSETMEKMVIYKPLYHSPEFESGTLWVRPLTMFLETVVIEGAEIPRFKKI